MTIFLRYEGSVAKVAGLHINNHIQPFKGQSVEMPAAVAEGLVYRISATKYQIFLVIQLRM